MEVFSSKTETREVLSKAFLLYGSFATVHEIGHRKEGPVILPGTLATKDGLAEALRALLPPESRGTGLIPATLLASGVGYMVWWIPPAKRQLWFNAAELGGEKHAEMPLPGLVMATTPSQWMVFAVKGKSRPTPDSKLYQAPFFNVWEGGRICTGTARLPDEGNRQNPEKWESAFFESYFTHPNIHTSNGLVKGGAYAFWRDMLEGKYAKFPESMLVDAKLTLNRMYSQKVIGGADDE